MDQTPHFLQPIYGAFCSIHELLAGKLLQLQRTTSLYNMHFIFHCISLSSITSGPLRHHGEWMNSSLPSCVQNGFFIYVVGNRTVNPFPPRDAFGTPFYKMAQNTQYMTNLHHSKCKILQNRLLMMCIPIFVIQFLVLAILQGLPRATSFFNSQLKNLPGFPPLPPCIQDR